MSEKQLTFSQVKKDNKKYQEKERIEFNDGEFYLDIYQNFEPRKVQAMLKEIGETFTFAKENNIEIPSEITYDIVNCFIIKNFTSIPSPKDTNKLIQGFIDLINSDYYIQIMQAFSQDSLQKVFDKILKGMEVSGQLETNSVNLKNELNNKELID